MACKRKITILLSILCVAFSAQNMAAAARETFAGEGFTEDEYKTFVAARKLANKVFQILERLNNEGPERLELRSDARESVANSNSAQTTQGLVLETMWGFPSKIYTPCGEWHIGTVSINGMRNSEQKFLDALSLDVYSEDSVRCFGVETGKRLALQSVDGEHLPVPELLFHSSSYSLSETRKKEMNRLEMQWIAMKAKFEKESK